MLLLPSVSHFEPWTGLGKKGAKREGKRKRDTGKGDKTREEGGVGKGRKEEERNEGVKEEKKKEGLVLTSTEGKNIGMHNGREVREGRKGYRESCVSVYRRYRYQGL